MSKSADEIFNDPKTVERLIELLAEMGMASMSMMGILNQRVTAIERRMNIGLDDVMDGSPLPKVGLTPEMNATILEVTAKVVRLTEEARVLMGHDE